MKVLLKILVLEVLTIPFVILTFKLSSSKKIGGAFAGSIFLLLCFIILTFLVRNFKNWRKMFTTYGLGAHFFLAVLPLMVTRLYYWSSEFADYQVFGMQAPDFHKFSEKVYLLMIFCTLIDLLIKKRSE